MHELTDITQHSQPTMSSREIATLCDKEHRNVCRDIENLNLEYGKLSLPKVGECDYTTDNGQMGLPNFGEAPPIPMNKMDKISKIRFPIKLLKTPKTPSGGRPSQEYGLYYLSKSPHSDKQVEHFRYFEKADKGF